MYRDALRSRARRALRAPAVADDHGALGALCTEAVTHKTTAGVTRMRHRTTVEGGYVPMDARACFDGEFIYLVRAARATRAAAIRETEVVIAMRCTFMWRRRCTLTRARAA